jgi:hypothetical protein
MAKVLENERGFPDPGDVVMAEAGKAGLNLRRGQPTRAAAEEEE